MTALPRSLSRRFRLLRELGGGGGGNVFLVEDLAGGPSPKALKIVPSAAADGQAALLRGEFEAARRLRHPNLVEVYDFGQTSPAGARPGRVGTGDRATAAAATWFSSEYVPGPDLYGASVAWSEAELESALAVLADLLQFLHDGGIVHNDFKPSNVRVPAGPTTLRLLDFGVASGRPGDTSGGTLPYMAPERLVRSGAPGSAASDLFALGVTIYRCATRRLPFLAQTADEMRAAVRAGPIPPRMIRPDLGTPFESVVMRLLRFDPAERYPSAARLLDDLAQAGVADASEATVGGPLPLPPLAGRDNLLAEFRASWRRVQEGGRERFLLCGGAGLGKSRLLAEWKSALQLEAAAVVDVHAERGPPRAWALVADIVRRTRGLPGMPRPPAALVALLGGGERPGVLVAEVGHAFGEYIRSCARRAPLALLLDDLEIADSDSASAVADLAQSSGGRLLCVAALRDEGAPTALRDRLIAAGFRMVPVPPISHDAARHVLASLFPGTDLPGRLTEDALAQAGGNPLALEEIARLWIGTRTLRRKRGAWTVTEGAAAPVGGRPYELIGKRVRALPPDSLATLRAVALHGRPLPRSALARLLPSAAGHLDALVGGAFLVETAGGFDVRHRLVRQAALDGLAPSDVAALHLRLGQGLADLGRPPEDIWHHFLRGGDPRKGLRQAVAAGLHAEAVEDHSTGLAILEEARAALVRAPGMLGAAEAAQLSLSLATCVLAAGDARRAAVILEEAVVAAPPPVRPRLRATLGRALDVAGDPGRAVLEFARVDAKGDPLLAIETACWNASALNDLARAEEAVQACQAVLPVARRIGRRQKDPHAARILARFYLVFALVRGNADGGAAVLPELDAAVRHSERSGLGSLPLEFRVARAQVRVLRGDLADGIDELEAVRRSAQESGSAWLLQMVREFLGYALHHRGQTRAGIEHLHAALGAGPEGGRHRVRGILVDVWADIGDPRSLPGALEVAREGEGGRFTTWDQLAFGSALRAAVWLGAHDAMPAIAAAFAGLGRMTVAPVNRGDVEARLAMSALGSGDAAGAVAHMEEACRLSHRFSRILLPRYQFHLAHALALCGRRDKARAAAADAERAYQQRGNQAECARARALGDAIMSGRIGQRPPTLAWLERLDAAFEGAVPVAPVERLVAAVAGASGATGVWLMGGSSAEPRLLARAGPCAGADPIAWDAAIEAAMAAGAETQRKGVGLVLPLALPEGRAALVVEDRTWPQAFSPEAAAIVRQAARRGVDLIARQKLDADLFASRRAIARPARTPQGAAARLRRTGAPDFEAPTASKRQTTAAWLEATVGSVELRRGFGDLVGRSSAMTRALAVLERLADTDAAVLITGETGTGKEMFARALHASSARSTGPFLVFPCGATPSTLFEAELLGSRRGAFTGATADRAGLVEQAAGGTLLLDEVGELGPKVQVKLLRFLQERRFRPLGASEEIATDVRVVATTHHDLAAEVERGVFRGDLYYRLAVIELGLPPLRERLSDLPLLCRHLLTRHGLDASRLRPRALAAMRAYPWPGNVRELENELMRASVLSGGGAIDSNHLSPRVTQAPSARRGQGTLAETERRHILDTLRRTDGNRTRAAAALGLSRVGLFLKLRRMGLTDAMKSKKGGQQDD